MSYTLQLHGTAACLLRDELRKCWLNKVVTMHQIRERLSQVEMPFCLQSQIVQMVNHNMTKRVTCPIEQILMETVASHVITDIIEG